MSGKASKQDIVEFVKAITMYSKLVNFDLTDEITMFYIESLKQFDLARCRTVLLKLARSARPGRGLPSIDDILTEVAPQAVVSPSPEDDGALAAERIAGCLVKFGSYDDGSGVFKTQRDYIGELGWQVVQASGGWMYLCTTVTNDSLVTLKSQWRKEAQAYAVRAKGGMSAAPALPGPLNEVKALGPAYELLDQGIRSLDPAIISNERKQKTEEARRKIVEDVADMIAAREIVEQKMKDMPW